MPFDIGIGIMLGLILAPYDSNTAANVAVGITFTLLPDLDSVIYYGSKITGIGGIDKKVADHRDIFHYPLVFMLIGVPIIALINTDLVPIFILGSLVQFIHDSIGVGWGIPWLYPINKSRFKFLYQYDLYKAGQPQRLLWRWSKNEQDELIKKYGDEEWHKHTFQFWKYAPTWQIGEVVIFAVSIVVLVLYVN